MFTRLDKSGDRRLTLAEFTQALPTLEKWGICIPDTQAAFKEIDANGGGFVLFDEFVGWAMMKNLDLDEFNEDLKYYDSLVSTHKYSCHSDFKSVFNYESSDDFY